MKKICLIFILLIVLPLNIYSQSQLKNIVDLSKSPINTFKQSCSRCHGSEGSAYGEGFADMEEDDLREIVTAMMRGPAQLKPDENDIEAMIGYNKSLKDKKPFAIVLNAKSFLDRKDKNLLVSISPKAKLHVNNSIKIEEVNGIWKLIYDSEKNKKLEIAVTRNNNSVSFYFPDKLWSE